MQTEVLSAGTPEETRAAVGAAVARLRAGETVALPTETVYGLAADALDAEACARIFEAKGRPRFDPLIVHVRNEAMLDEVAEVPAAAAEAVRRLMAEFWPGPLTFVLPRRPAVPDIVTAGLPTVAVRSPKNPLFRAVLKELGRPLAAPSANRFGSISPTSAAAVMAELAGEIPLVVDAGACSDGVESTIVRVGGAAAGGKARIELLRPGPVTVEMLKRFGKVEPAAAAGGAPDAPGQLASHYAPRTPLRLLGRPEDFEAAPGRRYALLSYRGQEKDGYLGLHEWDALQVLSPGSGKLPEAAVRFFFALRTLDGAGVDEIVAEPIPKRGVGLAIADRLERAAAAH